MQDLLQHVTSHCCNQCGNYFQHVHTHVCSQPPLTGGGPTHPIINTRLVREQTAHQGALATYSFSFEDKNFFLLSDAIDFIFDDVARLTITYVKHFINLKIKSTFFLKLKENKTGETINRHFHSIYINTFHSSFVIPNLEFLINYIISTINLFRSSKSGYTVLKVLKYSISFALAKPSTVGNYLPLPPAIKSRQGIISIKTIDTDNCFLLSVLAKLFFDKFRLLNNPELDYKDMKYSQRQAIRKKLENPHNFAEIIALVEREKKISIDGFRGHVELEMIKFFEKANDISINVYSLNKADKKIWPIQLTTRQSTQHVDLLLIRREQLDDEQKQQYSNIDFHFALILEPSRFFSKGCDYRRCICKFCANFFSKNTIGTHEQDCLIKSKLSMEFPKAKHYTFKEYFKSMSAPYRIYCEVLTCMDKDEPSKIVVYGFHMMGMGPTEEILFSHHYSGDCAIQSFVIKLIYCAEFLLNLQKNNHWPLLPTDEHFEAAKNTRMCENCSCSLNIQPSDPTAKMETPRMHHSHYISHTRQNYLDPNLPNYISFICNNCNLKLKARDFIYAYVYGCERSTFNLILEGMKDTLKTNFYVIPRKNQNYLSIVAPGLFRLTALENFFSENVIDLVKHYNTAVYAKYFEHYNRLFSGSTGPFFFPHNQCIEKTDKFPSQPDFYDFHLGRIVTPEEHTVVHTYFNENCKNMDEYAKSYMLFKTHAINAVFQSFNYWTLLHYKISAHHELSIGGLAFSAGMRFANKSFEYVKSPLILKHVSDHLIGGISHTSKKYARGFSERLGDTNVDDNMRTEILMADLKSQFSHSMTKRLPISDYELLAKSDSANINIDENWIMNIDDSIYGYLINVDTHYTPLAKSISEDLPFIPKRKEIDANEMLELQRDLYQATTHIGLTHVLLMQHDLKDTLLHYKFLQWFIKMGIKVTAINYVIKYRHEPFLKDYILYNSNLRDNAETTLEKQQLKNLNNILYGKFYPATSNLSVRFCTTREHSQQLTARSDFSDVLILNPSLSMFFLRKKKTMYDKNLLIAFVILQNSLLTYYKRAYQVKLFFGPRMEIIGGETDSIVAIYQDRDRDFISKLNSLSHIFDFSSLPKSHPLFSEANKNKIGVFKLEYEYPVEYVKLRSKSWAVRALCPICKAVSEGSEFCDKCQGGVLAVYRGGPKDSTFELYLKVLNEEKQVFSEYFSIRARNEKVELVKRKRKMLINTDWKRKWISPLESRPFGHG